MDCGRLDVACALACKRAVRALRFLACLASLYNCSCVVAHPGCRLG